MYQLNIQKGKARNWELWVRIKATNKSEKYMENERASPILKANSLKVTNTTNGWESTHNKCDFKASKPLTEPQQ